MCIYLGTDPSYIESDTPLKEAVQQKKKKTLQQEKSPQVLAGRWRESWGVLGSPPSHCHCSPEECGIQIDKGARREEQAQGFLGLNGSFLSLFLRLLLASTSVTMLLQTKQWGGGLVSARHDTDIFWELVQHERWKVELPKGRSFLVKGAWEMWRVAQTD